MKEKLGVISFWIRLSVLACVLFWNLMGILKRAALENVRG